MSEFVASQGLFIAICQACCLTNTTKIPLNHHCYLILYFLCCSSVFLRQTLSVQRLRQVLLFCGDSEHGSSEA